MLIIEQGFVVVFVKLKIEIIFQEYYKTFSTIDLASGIPGWLEIVTEHG